MGVFWRGVPQYLAKSSAELLGTSAVAVETGTYLGDSAFQLAKRFSKCYTIELDETLATNAFKRFIHVPAIEVLQGSTRDRLPEILAKVKDPLFVWLDAHYSGGVTAGKQDKCPVLAEIEAIQKFREPINTIVLIDDARGFLGQNDWPFLGDVVRAFNSPDWVIAAIDDVLIATSRANLTRILENSYEKSRLFALEKIAGQWIIISSIIRPISLVTQITGLKSVRRLSRSIKALKRN